jgi:hypothetical protein
VNHRTRHTDPSSACTNDPGEHCDLCDGAPYPCETDDIRAAVAADCKRCGAEPMIDQTGEDWCYCDTPGTSASEIHAAMRDENARRDTAATRFLDALATGDLGRRCDPLSRDAARYEITAAGLQALAATEECSPHPWGGAGRCVLHGYGPCDC